MGRGSRGRRAWRAWCVMFAEANDLSPEEVDELERLLEEES
jgi:hypothetical protein